MVLKLYKFDASPPVRAVYLTAAALELQLELIDVDIEHGNQLNTEYLEINPQHCVPTIDDDGTIIWDSHAINAYLVSKYGKNDSLYPKNLYKRAIVDQRLHFDSCNLFSLLRFTFRKLKTFGADNGEDKITKHCLVEYNKALQILDGFLEKTKWVAGECVTIADFSLISTVTSLHHMIPLDLSKYPNIANWIKQVEELPYYNVTCKGNDDCKEMIRAVMK